MSCHPPARLHTPPLQTAHTPPHNTCIRLRSIIQCRQVLALSQTQIVVLDHVCSQPAGVVSHVKRTLVWRRDMCSTLGSSPTPLPPPHSPCLPPLQCRTLTQFGNCSGETLPKGGPLRSGSYCGAALHRRYLMVLASAQLGARPERKDGGHPALCNATPQWLHQRHQSHQSLDGRRMHPTAHLLKLADHDTRPCICIHYHTDLYTNAVCCHVKAGKACEPKIR